MECFYMVKHLKYTKYVQFYTNIYRYVNKKYNNTELPEQSFKNTFTMFWNDINLYKCALEARMFKNYIHVNNLWYPYSIFINAFLLELKRR